MLIFLTCPQRIMRKREKDEKSEMAKHDVAVSSALSLKSWEPKKAFATVISFNCGKPRCLLTNKKQGVAYQLSRKKLMKRLESISHMYSCGDLIFRDDEAPAKVISQRLNLTCESPVKKCYYNITGRSFQTTDICIHCAAQGLTDYLFGQKQLEDLNKTEGKVCYPICKVCLEAGKTVVKYPKKKTTQSRKTKERAVNTVAQARKRRKKD